MIEYAGAGFLVVGFIVILKVFELVDKSARVIDISKRAVADLRSAQLDEDAKELAMQTYAKQLFGLFFLLTAGGLAALLLPVAVIWSLDWLGLISFDAVMHVALSWHFILITTILILIVMMTLRAR